MPSRSSATSPPLSERSELPIVLVDALHLVHEGVPFGTDLLLGEAQHQAAEAGAEPLLAEEHREDRRRELRIRLRQFFELLLELVGGQIKKLPDPVRRGEHPMPLGMIKRCLSAAGVWPRLERLVAAGGMAPPRLVGKTVAIFGVAEIDSVGHGVLLACGEF